MVFLITDDDIRSKMKKETITKRLRNFSPKPWTIYHRKPLVYKSSSAEKHCIVGKACFSSVPGLCVAGALCLIALDGTVSLISK